MKYLFLKGLFMAEQRNQTPAGDNTQWTTVIRPRTGWFDVDLEELWRYRDLIVMFVKRNFTVMYKQTILGPLWIILNPLITTVLFNVVFGGIAGLSTDGTPSFLFYMAGNKLLKMVTELLDFQKIEQSAEQVRLQDIELPCFIAFCTSGRFRWFSIWLL